MVARGLRLCQLSTRTWRQSYPSRADFEWPQRLKRCPDPSRRKQMWEVDGGGSKYYYLIFPCEYRQPYDHRWRWRPLVGEYRYRASRTRPRFVLVSEQSQGKRNV